VSPGSAAGHPAGVAVKQEVGDDVGFVDDEDDDGGLYDGLQGDADSKRSGSSAGGDERPIKEEEQNGHGEGHEGEVEFGGEGVVQDDDMEEQLDFEDPYADEMHYEGGGEEGGSDEGEVEDDEGEVEDEGVDRQEGPSGHASDDHSMGHEQQEGQEQDQEQQQQHSDEQGGYEQQQQQQRYSDDEAHSDDHDHQQQQQEQQQHEDDAGEDTGPEDGEYRTDEGDYAEIEEELEPGQVRSAEGLSPADKKLATGRPQLIVSAAAGVTHFALCSAERHSASLPQGLLWRQEMILAKLSGSIRP